MICSEEDLINFKYLDDAFDEKQTATNEKFQIIEDFINHEIIKKTEEVIQKLGGGREQQSKKIKTTFLAYQLNEFLEYLHTNIYKSGFKIILLLT
jgi:hypothetical protein